MDGIKRNLLYWGYVMGQIVLMMVAMVLGISLVTGLDKIGDISRVFCETMSQHGVMYMLLFMCMLGMQGINSSMPLTVSMGSTRRDSFIGMEVMLHLEGLVLIGIIHAADIFLGKAVNSMVFLNDAVLLAASAALCNLVGLMCLRFGKVVGLILYFVLLIGGVLGVSVLYAAGLLDKWGLSGKWGLSAFVAGVAAADCVMILLYGRAVKQLEVRV